VSIRLVPIDSDLVHEFIVTDAIPEPIERKEAGLPELPVMRDPESSFYVRQEGVGLAMGAYEEKGTAVFVDGVPSTFGQELFPDELDKLLPYLEAAAKRVPLLERAGVKDVINGPMPYTPDDMPTTGPAFGLRNFWLGEGNPFGITLAGGIGWRLARVDRRGRVLDRHVGLRLPPLRGLRDAALLGRQDRGSLRAHLPAAEARGGAAGGAAAQDQPDPRPAGGPRRRVRSGLRLGAPQLVRARGRGGRGRMLVSPAELLRARGQGVSAGARGRRPGGYPGLFAGSLHSRYRPGFGRATRAAPLCWYDKQHATRLAAKSARPCGWGVSGQPDSGLGRRLPDTRIAPGRPLRAVY
jgi:hypothetical protein